MVELAKWGLFIGWDKDFFLWENIICLTFIFIFYWLYRDLFDNYEVIKDIEECDKRVKLLK